VAPCAQWPFPIYIENADGTNLHPVPNTEGGQNASFSPDGRWLIFDRAQGSLVIRSHGYAIRLDGTGRRRLTNSNGEGEPSWSPDGTRVIYACAIHPDESHRPVDPGGIPHAICEISNSHPISRTLYLDPSQAVTDPTWNADGSKILVTLRRTDRAALPLGRSTSPDHASPRQRFGSRLVTRSTSAIVDWMERPSGLITLKRNMTREMSNGR
jgi:WD40 repeat protein